MAGLNADPAFDHDGLVIADTTHAAGSQDVLSAVDVVAGDKQWAAGTAQTGIGFCGAVTRLNADGSPDVTFGGGGRLISSLFFEFTDVKGLSDGGAVLTGFVNGPDATHDFGLLKLLADGTPDVNFGTRGLATADFGGTDDKPQSIAVLGDGSFLVAGDSFQANYDFAVAKFTPQGNLDTNFSTDGLQLIDFDGFDDRAREVEVDGSGRVVIAGSAYDGNDKNFALARLTSAGAPDNAFGTAGEVTTDFANANRDDEAFSLEIQSGNNIVAGGYTVNASGDRDFALARYSATNGSLLAGFGTGGQVVVDFNRNPAPSQDEIREIKLDSSGRIVALGTAEDTTPAVDMAIVVVNGTSGAVDTSFDANTGGRLYLDFFAYTENRGAALDIDSSGRWIAGSSAGRFQPNFGITRLNGATGAVDPTYGNNGRVAYDFNDQQGLNDDGRGVALFPDGSAIVVGQNAFQYGSAYKLTPSGVLDDTFAANGKLLADIFYRFDDVTVLSDGSVVIVGKVFGPAGNYDIGVLKLLPSGAVDNAFGHRGLALADFGGTEDSAAIAVQSDGKVVVAGTTNVNGDLDFAIARFDTTGNLDSTFDADGLQTVDFLNFDDTAYDVAIDGSNRIVVVGSAGKGGNTDFGLVRLTTTGALDTGFGGTGKVQTDFSAANRNDVAYSVVIQSGNAVVAAGSHVTVDGDTDFAAARYGSGGLLQAGFGTGGQATIDFTSGANDSDDEAREVSLDASGRLVLAGTTYENTAFLPRKEIAQVVLDGTSGQIVTSYNENTGGRLYTSVFTYYQTSGNAMAIDSSGRWVTAGSTSDYNVAVLRQNGSTGALDAAYANGGRAIVDGTDLTGHSDSVGGVDIDAAGRTVIVGTAGGGGTITRLTAAGQLDSTFGVGGVTYFEFGDLTDVAVQADGTILAGGTLLGDFLVLKLNDDGSVVRTFGNNGVALADFGFSDHANSLAVQNDGAIVLAGSSNSDFAVARFTAGGNLDTNFSADGLVTIDFLGFSDDARRVKIDSQNRIVLAGSADDGNDTDFALARLTTTGTPDNSFGTQGKVRTDFGGANRNDQAAGLVVQAGDTLVAGGFTTNANGDQDWALARYGVNGSAQAGFGNNGQVVVDFTSSDQSDDDISDLQLDSTGRLIAFGTTVDRAPFDAHWAYAVAAFNGVNGAIDASVNPDTGGRFLLDFYAERRISAKDLEIDGNDLAVFTGITIPGDIAAARFFLGNVAPVLDNSAPPTLPAVNEDATNPSGALVSSFAAALITDANSDPEGIAVIGASQIGGVWEFSTNGGTTWANFGSPSDTAARLLAPDSKVRFLPNTNFNGTAQLTFRAWDESDALTVGSTVDTTGKRGGSGSISTASVAASLTVNPVNDAPTLTGAQTPPLNPINEDDTNPPGTLVSAFANVRITDVDAGALKGMAVVGLTDAVNGTWQFSLNGGTSWTNFGSPSDTAARVLVPTNLVRFVPNPNYNGSPQLLWRAWDRTDGAAAGSVVNTSGQRGGTGAYSSGSVAGAKVTVNPVNDAPVLATGSNPTLNPVSEDATNPAGTLVSAFANPKISDVDAGALKGIAVVGLTEKVNGTWQFSINGGTSWTNLGSPSDTAARVLDPANLVRFIPNPNYNGTPQLVFRAWDQTDSAAAGSVVNTTGKRGGTGAYSSGSTLSAKLTVTAVNDAPLLATGSSPTLNPIDEDATNPGGTTVTTFAVPKITDPDAGALKGIAVVGLTEKINGTWQFSLNGTTWTNLGSPSDTAARVLKPGNLVRFKPNANYNGTPQLVFRAWDQTDGAAAGSVVDTSGKRGGTGAYSSGSVLSAKLTVNPVNDKPVLGLSGTVSYVRGAPAVILAPSATVTDIDSANFAGGELRVRITAGGGANNTLGIGGGFTVDASNNVKLNGTTIGTRTSNGVGTNELRITFNTSATTAIVQQLVRAINYKNIGGSAGTRTIAFTVSDGDGGLSDQRTKTVNVT